MRLGAPLTLVLAILALVGAGAAEWRLRPHAAQAAGLLAQARQDASAYVATFDGAHVDAQLEDFRLRREALAHAHACWLLRNVLLMLAGALLVLAWGQGFLHRLEGLRVEPGPIHPATDPRTQPLAAIPARAR